MIGRIGRMVGVLLAVLVTLGLAGPASAEAGDHVRLFGIEYVVRPDGKVDVTEHIEYEFASSGRHGIYRELITRQPFGDGSDRDVRYDISDIRVRSSDAPDDVEKSTHHSGFRHDWIELKIGDPDETISGTSATYEIRYTIAGALRTVGGVPELYWNATGNAWDADLDRVEVQVSGPATPNSVSCYQGPVGSTQTCDGEVEGGRAKAVATGLKAGEGVTISVQLPADSVRNAEPIIEPAGTFLRRAHLGPLTIGGSLLAVLLSILAAVGMTRANRDRRYAGTPPGVIDPDAPVVIDDIDEDAIPVRFNPPDLPPAVGGRLLSSSAAPRGAAATLAELAHRGVLHIDAVPQNDKKFKDTGGMQRTARLVDLAAAPEDYRRAFATALLGDGGALVLDEPDTEDAKRFAAAASALTKDISKQATDFREKGGPPRSGLYAVLGAFVALAITLVMVIKFAPAGAIWLLPGGLSAVGLFYAAFRRAYGYRTAEARALTDQVVGFKRYIATAEAGQLQFEEGQDIFSAYLPWAIMFGLADRWQQVCAELARQGRIPATPVWYSGPSFYDSFPTGSSFGDSLSSSVSNSSSSGSSGSGSSGGGGGGGGGGSW